MTPTSHAHPHPSLEDVVHRWNERFRSDPGSPRLSLAGPSTVEVLDRPSGKVVAVLSPAELRKLDEAMARLGEVFHDAA